MEKEHKCNFYSKEFSFRSQLKPHVLSQHERRRFAQKKHFKCSFCGFDICTEKQLIDHMRTHTGERPFNCTVDGCGMTFKLELTLKNHIKYKHSTERPLKCKFPGCHFTAKTDVTLIGHMRVHSDYWPFACPNEGCNFRARERCHMTRHVKSVHSEAKAFACSMCDYKTSRSDTLKYHMYRHTTRRDFKCAHPQCTQSFKTSHDLKLHFSNQHEVRNVKCDAPGCGRKYANANALYKHKWAMHSKKRIACPNLSCNYSTNKPRELVAHMIVHDGKDRKILCSIKGCEYRGKTTRSLELHMRRHGTLFRCPITGCSRYTFTKDGLADHAKLHNPLGRPFQCSFCFKNYTTRAQLRSHVVAHVKEKPFSCGHCDFASFRPAPVQAHISNVHENVTFPVIVLRFDDRVVCLHCKVTLPLAEYVVHSMGHLVPVVMLQRLETK